MQPIGEDVAIERSAERAGGIEPGARADRRLDVATPLQGENTPDARGISAVERLRQGDSGGAMRRHTRYRHRGIFGLSKRLMARQSGEQCRPSQHGPGGRKAKGRLSGPSHAACLAKPAMRRKPIW
jgi:hypothetical protein